jgi:predicted dehydrogenase
MAADLAALPGCRLHSVTARSLQSASSFGYEHGAKVSSSLSDLLADDDLDLVYINSPNHLHFPQAKLALEAGKPVLCEKPFTLNAAQLAELVDLARAKRLFLMEAMWVRFLPAVVRLRRLLAEGRIGDLTWLHASFHSKPPRGPGNRFYDLGMGGGALLDLGVYPISFASMAFGGPPQRVASSVRLSETGVDERFSALFEYEGGGCAALSAGFGGHFEDQIVLQGTQGQIRIPRFEGWNMDRLFVDTPGAVEEIREPMDGRGYGYQAVEVVRCLEARELESPSMPLDESLAIMKTLDNLRAQWGMVFPGE